MTKKLIVGLFGGLLLILNFSLLSTSLSPYDPSLMNQPLSAYTSTLPYNYYSWISWDAEGNDVISWSFSSSLTYIGITVYAMDADEYWNFNNGYTYTFYLLSSGIYYSASGNFEIPYSETWYIIFWNRDPDMTTTTLTYSGSITYYYFGGTYIDYGGYGYSYFPDPLNVGDTVDWEFTGSNNAVGITAMAMDADQYWNFDNGYYYTYYTLSSGGYLSDSGTFTVPYKDIWYFVFWNHDSDQEATDIVWDVTHYATGFSLDITSPTSSDSWTVGTWHYIYYDVTRVDYVDLLLYQDGFYLSTIVTDLSATGSYYWYIPSTLYADSNYQIYIQDHTNTLVNDLSDEFTIVNPLTLPYNYYRYDSLTAAGGDSIDWYFTGSNTDVGIIVYAMDSEEFYNFQNALPYDYYLESAGNYYSSSGSFDIPYSDTWYICFMNWDSSQEPTNIEIDIVLQENYFGGIRIDYGEYGYYSHPETLYSGDIIQWLFTGTNPDVNIIVYAMDSSNFTNFAGGYAFYPSVLCTGATEDDGLFMIPYEGAWYFVFVNLDTVDQKPTDIGWNITLLEYTDDTFEENDNYLDAATISEGNYPDLAALDDDWYIISLQEGDTITIDLYFSHADGDIDIALVDMSVDVVASSQTMTDHEHIEYIVETTGNYFILIYEFTPNPEYDMIIDVTHESTTSTTTTTATETTTESTDTTTSEDTNTSVDTKFGFDNIPGYSLSFLACAGVFGIILVLSRKKTHK